MTVCTPESPNHCSAFLSTVSSHIKFYKTNITGRILDRDVAENDTGQRSTAFVIEFLSHGNGRGEQVSHPA